MLKTNEAKLKSHCFLEKKDVITKHVDKVFADKAGAKGQENRICFAI